MKTDLKIAIDCDEVLRDTLNHMVRIYNEEFNDSMKKEDVKDFNVEISFPKIRTELHEDPTYWFFEKHSTELFFNSPAFAGVDWAVEELKKYGDVSILSYQESYRNKIDTLNFLNKNNIETTNVCFLKDKSRFDCDIMIDDNPKYFIGCKAKVCVLITAPYNKDLDLNFILENCNCEKVLRFNSLFDFAKYFRQINGNLI